MQELADWRFAVFAAPESGHIGFDRIVDGSDFGTSRVPGVGRDGGRSLGLGAGDGLGVGVRAIASIPLVSAARAQ